MTTAAIIKSKITLDNSEYMEGIGQVVEGSQQLTESAAESTEQFKLYSDMIETVNKAGGDYAQKYAEIMNLHQGGEATWEETNKLVGDLKEEFDVTGGSIGVFAEQEKEATKKSKDFSKSLGQLAKGLLGVATIYAVGRGIVKFASDSLKAAKDAGILNKEFIGLEKASEKAKTSFGAWLSQVFAPMAKGFSEVTEKAAGYFDAQRAIEEAYDQGIITGEERMALRREEIRGLKSHAEIVQEMTLLMEALGIAEESEMEIAMRQAKGWAERGHALNEMAEAMGAFEEQVEDVANAFEGVDENILSTIESNMELLERLRAGGKELTESYDAFWAAIESGAINAFDDIVDAGHKMFEAAALGLEVELGKISYYEAGRRFQDQFGGTVREGIQEIMLNWAAMQVYLNEISLEDAAQEIHDQLGIPIEEARTQLFALAAKLRAIDGMVSEATVIITTYETTGGTVGGGTYGQMYQRKARQLGGRFFAGETMLVGEAGIEVITAGVGGQVIPNEALDNSGVEERLESVEAAIMILGEDILQGISMAVG